MKNDTKYQTIPIGDTVEKERVLSIYLTYRGFGFTIFEDAKTVVDWGHASVEKHDQEIFKKRISTLIENNQIETVLSYSPGERPKAIRKNINSLNRTCKRYGVNGKIIDKNEIASVFESFGTYTKYQRAGLVASFLPYLAYKLPPKRKPWQSEDLRMAIFDSACLAISYFYMK